MKSFLAKLASVAVMLHMTFGCSLHHGVGAHGCQSQCNASSCATDSCATDSECSRDGCGSHERDQHSHQSFPDSDSKICDADSHHGFGHRGCKDDGCSVIQQVKFVFAALDYDAQYQGGAESASLVHSLMYCNSDDAEIPNCFLSATGMRAHLVLNVQLL